MPDIDRKEMGTPSSMPNDASGNGTSGYIRNLASALVGRGYWTTNAVPDAQIESITIADGPHGIRRQVGQSDNLGTFQSEPAVCFPTESCTACSFDEELLYQIGLSLASEARRHGVNVVLGPGINMKRSPLAGRNFEYFSEDPYLSGILGAAYVRGVQDGGVAACPKHLTANCQESFRQVSDSIVDAQALHELYLEAFRIVVEKGDPKSLMPAYNKVNGVYCCESEFLLTQHARLGWGFDGCFISDWGAESSNERSLPAGLDLVMPGPRPDYPEDVSNFVLAGKIEASDLEEAVDSIRRLVDFCKDGADSPVRSVEECMETAYQAALKSTVLLENDGLLPLDRDMSIGIFGDLAKNPRYQGAGSSKVNAIQPSNLLDSLEAEISDVTFAQGCFPDGSTNAYLLEGAKSVARSVDACVVVIGLTEDAEAEGHDRQDMRLPQGMLELVDAVASANQNVCVILQCGAPVELAWESSPKAIICAYLGGAMGGRALASLLLGKASPSGKLAETWPKRLADTPTYPGFPSEGRRALFKESIFNGYRFYDASGVDAAYPFGHGLSYSSFAYSDLRIVEVPSGDEGHDGQSQSDNRGQGNGQDGNRIRIQPQGHGQREGLARDQARIQGNVGVDVEFSITNTGQCEAAESAQVYVAPHEDAQHMHAPKLLKGFAKVSLVPGETKTVRVRLDSHAFEHWSEELGAWVICPGEHRILVGASSKDIRLEGAVGQPCSDERIPDERTVDAYALSAIRSQGAAAYTTESFRELYGKPFPIEPKPGRPFDQNSLIGEIRQTISGRFFVWLIRKVARLLVRNDPTAYHSLDSLADDVPLRALSMAGMDLRVAQGIAQIMNFRFLKGAHLALVGLRAMGYFGGNA